MFCLANKAMSTAKEGTLCLQSFIFLRHFFLPGNGGCCVHTELCEGEHGPRGEARCSCDYR